LEKEGVNVQPSSRVVGIIQDKFAQKEYFAKNNIPLPPYVNLPSIDAIHSASKTFGLPLMLKGRKGAYDGRGNAVLKETTPEAISKALSDLGLKEDELDGALYAEGWINFHCEVAVMVVRSTTGETRAYPATTAIQTDSICRVVLVPARNVPANIRHRCEEVAMKAVDSLGDGATGMFGVELFLVHKEGGGMDVLLNEVAPRPHNTGHYTQDACAVSQFENHLRAVCGLPLGDTNLIVGAAAMINVLGAPSGGIEATMKGVNAAMSTPRSVVHWYGKGYRPGRKMGHINITADSHGELDTSLAKLLGEEGISEDVLPSDGRIGSSPLVGVIMGSQSDLPTMQDAVKVLRDFGIPYEVDIVSAHRTPEKLMTYSKSAAGRGLQVIIAGAGGAAHLPGMVAAMTPLPVVGVPIKTSTLNGQDSLLSIVQMPRGVPVATVAIGNAMNAGLLAVRSLCASRPDLREKMEDYQLKMKETVDGMSEALLEQGSDKFLEGMGNKSKSVNV
jgi:phosphoribosylaminoimidazole carboxylase